MKVYLTRHSSGKGRRSVVWYEVSVFPARQHPDEDIGRWARHLYLRVDRVARISQWEGQPAWGVRFGERRVRHGGSTAPLTDIPSHDPRLQFSLHEALDIATSIAPKLTMPELDGVTAGELAQKYLYDVGEMRPLDWYRGWGLPPRERPRPLPVAPPPRYLPRQLTVAEWRAKWGEPPFGIADDRQRELDAIAEDIGVLQDRFVEEREELARRRDGMTTWEMSVDRVLSEFAP